MSEYHPMQQHPKTFKGRCSETKNRFIRFNEQFLEFMSIKILGSLLLFDLSLIVPLLGLYGVGILDIKTIIMIISSNWIQLWALFAIQRLQVQSDKKRDAKNLADYRSGLYKTHLLEAICSNLGINTNEIQTKMNSFEEMEDEGHS